MTDTNETVGMPREGQAPADERVPNAVQSSPAAEAPLAMAYKPTRRSSGAVLAILVLLLVAAVIATAFTLVANRRISMADMRTLLELILGPLFALAGAALGFYFANR
jgi:hypothetical protein